MLTIKYRTKNSIQHSLEPSHPPLQFPNQSCPFFYISNGKSLLWWWDHLLNGSTSRRNSGRCQFHIALLLTVNMTSQSLTCLKPWVISTQFRISWRRAILEPEVGINGLQVIVKQQLCNTKLETCVSLVLKLNIIQFLRIFCHYITAGCFYFGQIQFVLKYLTIFCQCKQNRQKIKLVVSIFVFTLGILYVSELKFAPSVIYFTLH